MLGEQADKEVDPAEVASGQAGQPGPDFRLDLDLIQPCHASDAICICCYSQGGAVSRAGGLVSREDVVRVAPHPFGLGGLEGFLHHFIVTFRANDGYLDIEPQAQPQ